MGAAVSTDSKTCPDCAEHVKAAARICRFCGHRFEVAPFPAAAPREESSQPAAARSRALVIAALTVLGVAAALIAVVILAAAPDDRARSRFSTSRFESRAGERASWGVPAAAAIGITGIGVAAILLARRRTSSSR